MYNNEKSSTISHQNLLLPPKKQTVLWKVTVFLNALFTKHLLVQLLLYIAIVLVKILSKDFTKTINILLEKNTELSKYVLKLKERDIILLIGILLWNRKNMFVDLESVICAFVRSSSFQEQILMFCSINVMSLSQNPGLERTLLWSVLKIDRITYTIQCM